MSLQLKFALRAQCGRGRLRSQQHAAHFRCRRLLGKATLWRKLKIAFWCGAGKPPS